MSNEYKYETEWCPICNQGWIEIVKEQNTGKLFLCCDECEAEWNRPEDVKEKGKGSRFKFGKIEEPTLEEITLQGWEKYILKK